MGVTCQWALHCREKIPLQDLTSHLATKHSHMLRCITQDQTRSIKLSQVKSYFSHIHLIENICQVLSGHGDTSWPDSSGCCSPSIIMIRYVLFIIIYDNVITISALNNTFLLFLHTVERFRDDYNIAVAMVAPPQVADRYGYELRIFDEAGFAYRGPMLSVVIQRDQFWKQVNIFFSAFFSLTFFFCLLQ